MIWTDFEGIRLGGESPAMRSGENESDGAYIPPVPGFTQFAADSYTDASGTAIASHTMDQGGPWVSYVGSSGGYTITDANRLRPSTSAVTTIYRTTTIAPSANAKTETTFFYAGTTAGATIAVCLGMNAATADYYMAYFVLTSNAVRLGRVNGGTNTQLGSDVALTFATSTTHKLGVRRVGSVIVAELDDVDVITVTDGTPLTAAGYAGLRMNVTTPSNTVGFHADNFVAKSA